MLFELLFFQLLRPLEGYLGDSDKPLNRPVLSTRSG